MKTIEENWGVEEWRAPELKTGDTILFSECGRVLSGGSNYDVDYRSHYFRLVKEEYGSIALLVKHGAGQERISEHLLRKIIPGLNALDSDNHYLLLYAVYQSHREGKKAGTDETTQRYRKAFVEGRLKKRKMPGRDAFKVWIE